MYGQNWFDLIRSILFSILLDMVDPLQPTCRYAGIYNKNKTVFTASIKGGHELKGWHDQEKDGRHDNCKSFEKQNILVNSFIAIIILSY